MRQQTIEAAAWASNAVTLTNQIALVLKQSAHANLSTTTSSLLAQRIVQQCLPDYDQRVNSHDALVTAAKNALDAVFNDGKQPDGWVQIQLSALDGLRTATELAESDEQAVTD